MLLLILLMVLVVLRERTPAMGIAELVSRLGSALNRLDGVIIGVHDVFEHKRLVCYTNQTKN